MLRPSPATGDVSPQCGARAHRLHQLTTTVHPIAADGVYNCDLSSFLWSTLLSHHLMVNAAVDEIARMLYGRFGIPYAVGFAIDQASFYDGTWFGVEHSERVYRYAEG